MSNREWDRIGLAALAGLGSGIAGGLWGLSYSHSIAITLWAYSGCLLVERALKHE